MSFKKQMSLNRGFTDAAPKGQVETISVWTRKKTDQQTTKDLQHCSSLSLHIVLSHWTGRALGHLIQVHPLFHASFSYSIRFKMRHGHECYKNNISYAGKIQCDLMPDYNPTLAKITDLMAIKILHLFVQNYGCTDWTSSLLISNPITQLRPYCEVLVLTFSQIWNLYTTHCMNMDGLPWLNECKCILMKKI